MSRVVEANSVLGIRGTFSSNPCNQLGGLLARDCVVVVFATVSDWDGGGDSCEDGDPEHDAKKSRTSEEETNRSKMLHIRAPRKTQILLRITTIE
jgi:hypothetical protein